MLPRAQRGRKTSRCARAMIGARPNRYQGVRVSQYKPVLVHVQPDDWEAFTEIHEKGNLSARVRELVRQDVDRYTREEVQAQSLAGLTES
jgi:hypothetical protein